MGCMLIRACILNRSNMVCIFTKDTDYFQVTTLTWSVCRQLSVRMTEAPSGEYKVAEVAHWLM